MTARGWKRLGAGLAIVALAATGIHYWRAHREAIAKSVIAAEIRAARAARPRPVVPAPTEEEALTASLYRAAMAKLFDDYGAVSFLDPLWCDAMDQAPWTAVPPAVSNLLAANAESLALLDEATARDVCRFDASLQKSWSQCAHLRSLLLARGYTALARGATDEVAADLRRVLRSGRDLGSSPRSGESDRDGLWPGLILLSAERDATKLLVALATAPELPPEAVPALIDAARMTWGTAEANRRSVDEAEDASDASMLQMLGPDARALLDEVEARSTEFQNLMSSRSSERSLVDQAMDRVKEALSPGLSIPTAEETRVFLDLRAPVVAAVRRRDMVVLAPGGPYEKIGNLFGFLSPRWFRHKLADEARIAVARTAAAVRAFQIREGHPPADLEALVPSVLTEAIPDPFDGKPLIYEVTADGWRVASRTWRDPFAEKENGEVDYPPADVRFPPVKK